jgi:1,4-alpha-glucan branching enzyme
MTMPGRQDHISPQTPLGATLVGDGCTFRAWAPRARAVYVRGAFNDWRLDDSGLLVKNADGYWAGFLPGVGDGAPYKFYVRGEGSEGDKRDPCARELAFEPGYPHSNCVVRDPTSYPWHNQGFRPPAFNDLVIYQFHVGTFYAADAAGHDRRPEGGARFLDVLDRVAYLAELGVNAIEPLPVVEFPHDVSLGYNGVDFFAPEMAYAVRPGDLGLYVAKVNQLLAARGRGGPVVTAEQLASQPNQLKAMIDVCHAYGLAVLFDVVYNHAGGDFGGDQQTSESLYFFDRYLTGNENNCLYFTDQEFGGGRVFAYWNGDVRRFLIDNALFWLREYHADGFRYDEVSAISTYGGRGFCQELTAAVRSVKPEASQVAEYWNWDRAWPVEPGGGGFDLAWQDGLRDAVRSAIVQASGGRDAFVNLDPVRDRLYPPQGFPAAWQAVNCLENHDLLWTGHANVPRVAALADPLDARSWYARSRARVANGLLLTAPGVPMLFMGQEFLEEENWSDNPADQSHLLEWDRLRSDRVISDHLRFTRELIALRRRQPALRGERINVFHVHNGNRVLAFQRWMEDVGRDVVVAVSLRESTYYGYQLGFPGAGWWHEVFNSDVYDHWVNPLVAGNGTGVRADGAQLHGLPASASVVIPANGMIVFARDHGV